MPSTRTRFAIVIALLASLWAVPAVSVSATASERKTVDGVSIYLGIVPAEIVSGHPRGHPESEMHDGSPTGGHVYHLMIALYDEQTDKRITDARVSAAISDINHSGHQRTLEPMLIAGSIAYGNYFDLAGSGPYRIVVQIRRLDQPGLIEVEFVFKHARA